MEKSFWDERWRTGRIGFHEPAPNLLLQRHFGALALSPPARVFLPLCGKTLDIGWLLDQGFRVAGIEFSPIAIRDLFAALGLAPRVAAAGRLTRYSVPNLDIFEGDFFALDAATLGAVDAVYDRAALVALPPETRPRYAAHLRALSATAPQLLITCEYDSAPGCDPGPPFCVPAAAIATLYADAYTPTRLSRTPIENGLKNFCAATESTWLLTPTPTGP